MTKIRSCHLPLLLGWLIFSAVPDARAEAGDPIAKAWALASQGRIDSAIKQLNIIVESPQKSAQKRLEALELVGTLEFRRGRRAQANKAFRTLLTYDPGHVLKRPGAGRPLRAFFNTIKRRHIPDQEVELTVRAPPVLPAQGTVQIRTRASGPTTGVDEALVHVRSSISSSRPFVRVPMKRVGSRFTADIPAPAPGQALDYYVEVLAPSGYILVSAGSSEDPLQIQPYPVGQEPEDPRPRRVDPPVQAQVEQPVEPEDPAIELDPELDPEIEENPDPPRRRFYKRWWFWTIIGLAVAGGTTTAVVLTVPDDDTGGTLGTLSLP